MTSEWIIHNMQAIRVKLTFFMSVNGSNMTLQMFATKTLATTLYFTDADV